MCSPRGRSIAAKPVIIRSFTKTVQPLVPKPVRRGAEPLSCPSAGHAAPQPRSAFGSRHRWPARPATAFGIPDECTWVWPRSQHSRRPLGASGFWRALAGVSAQAVAGGAEEALPQPPLARGQALEPPFLQRRCGAPQAWAPEPASAPVWVRVRAPEQARERVRACSRPPEQVQASARAGSAAQRPPAAGRQSPRLR